MSFEEQFPSLKDKGVDSFEEENTDNVVETEEFWYPQDEILEFCLDKQKVREAIEKIMPHPQSNRIDSEYELTKALLKELGL
jgi:hypothetical protein